MSNINFTAVGTASDIFYEDLLLSQNYNLAVITTILGFDIIETFQDEVEYIWRKKWSMTTVLYLITRYVPLIIHIIEVAFESESFYQSWYTTGTIYCIPWLVVLGCTEYLFLRRALALNGNPRWLRYPLIGLYVGEVISGSVIYLLSLHPSVGLKLQNSGVVHINSPGQTVVQLTMSLVFVVAFGIPEIVFQSVLVLVIIGTIIRHWKTWTSLGKCSLTTIIVRDGLWGFFFNLFGLLVIIIQPIWLAGPNGQANLQWSYLTLSVTSSRLLLNIRSGAGTPGISTDTGTSSLSLITKSQKQIACLCL